MLFAGEEITSGDLDNGFSFEIYKSLQDQNQKLAIFLIADHPFARVYKLEDSDQPTVAVTFEEYVPEKYLASQGIKKHKKVFRQNLMSLMDKASAELDFNTDDYALQVTIPPKPAGNIKTLAKQFCETWGDMLERPDPIWGDIKSMFKEQQALPNFGKTCDGLPVTRQTKKVSPKKKPPQ